MSKWQYLAKNTLGKSEKGAIDANSSADATKILREKGLVVLDLKERKEIAGKSIFGQIGKGVSEKEKIVFTKQLSIMTKAGLPISQALRSAAEESSKNMAKVVTTVAADVEGGMTLSKAFAKHPEVFSHVYVSILQAGEKSGQVDEVLVRLSSQLEKDFDIKSKVKSALAYPVFVLIAMVVIVTLIMIFIIPQIESVFADNDAKLPILTVVIIAISHVLIHYYYIIIASILALVWAYRIYYRTPDGMYRIDLIKLSVPVFGGLNRKAGIARFARIFATLLSSGIPMLEIFETSKEVVGNEVFRRELTKVATDVENGLEISAALKKQPHIPSMMIQLTAVGEKSGDIDEIYHNLAEFMEKEVDNITRNLTTLLEPALMLIMGAVIGTIVIAILLPIYSLTSSIQ